MQHHECFCHFIFPPLEGSCFSYALPFKYVFIRTSSYHIKLCERCEGISLLFLCICLYYLRTRSNNPCTSPIMPPNNAPKYVIIFSSFFVMDRTRSSSLSVENVDTSCWTISARCRLFSMLSTFSVPHFKPFCTKPGTTFSMIVSRTGSHTC